MSEGLGNILQEYQKTFSSKMQLKTSFEVKKKSETTKIWNHDRWTDMFPHCKWYYAIIKFPGTHLVYRSTTKKQENDENWVLVSLIRSLGFPGDSEL